MDPRIRTWGPVVAVAASLPVAFVVVRACSAPIGGARPTVEPAAQPSSSRSEACGDCHEPELVAWQTSTHAVAEAPAGDRPALPDEPPWAGLEPVRRIGADPLWQYLVGPDERGRLQVSSIAYDPRAREWFDVFDDPREPGDWGHWTGGGMTWNSQCATCHSTHVDKGLAWIAESPQASAGPAYDTEVLEHRVGCVACHEAEGHPRSIPPQEVPPSVTEDTCMSCHALRADLTGAFRPGDRFLDHFAPTLVDGSDAFWPDGQIRAESFEYTAWIGSRMHDVGVRCVDCHDPHTGGLVREGDALCRECHLEEPHDPHPQGTVGCVGCHMPVTVYMQRDPRHDHGFPIPDPLAPAEVGPSACLKCHPDQDRAWVRSVVAQWWPALAPRSARGEAVAAARRGDPAGIDTLLRNLEEGRRVGWRATAAGALGAFVDRPLVQQAILRSLRDEDAVVRLAAADALGPVATAPQVRDALLQALADDPRRAVRVAATRALRPLLPPDAPQASEYRSYLSLNADQPSALAEQAAWAAGHGALVQAREALDRAVVLDPRSVELRDMRAVVFASAGQHTAAAADLEVAISLAPADPELWYRHGLAQAALGPSHHASAQAALRRATQLAPGHGRAWYNLGLVLDARGLEAEAEEALHRAAAVLPEDLEIQYGLAAVLFDHGRVDDALTIAASIVARDPGHVGARAILAQPLRGRR